MCGVRGVSLFLLLCAPVNLLAQQSWTEAAEMGAVVIEPAAAAPFADQPLSRGVVVAYSNRSEFESTFPGLTLEDFEDLDVLPGAFCAGLAPLNASTNDPGCVAPGDIVDGFQLDATPNGQYAVYGAGVAGVPSTVIGPSAFVDDAVLSFPGGVDVAASRSPARSSRVSWSSRSTSSSATSKSRLPSIA